MISLYLRLRPDGCYQAKFALLNSLFFCLAPQVLAAEIYAADVQEKKRENVLASQVHVTEVDLVQVSTKNTVISPSVAHLNAIDILPSQSKGELQTQAPAQPVILSAPVVDSSNLTDVSFDTEVAASVDRATDASASEQIDELDSDVADELVAEIPAPAEPLCLQNPVAITQVLAPLPLSEQLTWLSEQIWLLRLAGVSNTAYGGIDFNNHKINERGSHAVLAAPSAQRALGRDSWRLPPQITVEDMAAVQVQIGAYWHNASVEMGCYNDDASIATIPAVMQPHDKQYQAIIRHVKRLLAINVEQIFLRNEPTQIQMLSSASDATNPSSTSVSTTVIARNDDIHAHQAVLPSTSPWATLQIAEKITRGMEHSIIDEVANRLWLLGDTGQPLQVYGVYTDELMDVIKHFQRRHGLQQDGVIGKKTLFWINQSPTTRAHLLASNQLRRALFTRKLGERYLVVNIPAFEMQLVEHGDVVLQSRVIVGKASRQTPLLDSKISNVVLNPSWRVPRSIVKRDIVPHIRQDGYYLQERGFDVRDYDGQLVQYSAQQWQELAAYSSFPYRLEQRPGPKNALGKYKFHFENSFSVYLHDTSEPSLFNKDNRALSSGCVRVEKAAQLAQWFQDHLIKEKALWERLAPKVGDPQWFTLSDKLPVHLTYWTAWVDNHDLAQYRNDVYQLEDELNRHNIEPILAAH